MYSSELPHVIWTIGTVFAYNTGSPPGTSSNSDDVAKMLIGTIIANWGRYSPSRPPLWCAGGFADLEGSGAVGGFLDKGH
jgi:hypothetical protein